MAEPTPDSAPRAPAESRPSSSHDPVPGHVAPTRKRRWVGRAVALLVIGGLIGGSYYLMNRPTADAGGTGRPGGPGGAGARGGPGGPGGPGGAGGTVTVGQATVQRMQMPITLDALGTVTPLVTATISPQVGGTLAEVLFTEGQKVKKGDLLARIDPRTYEQALAQARGTRARDEAQLEAARVTLSRYRTLLGQDSIARQDVDTQAALVKQLEGTVLSDKASEDTARLNLSFTRITSPVTGTIGLRTVDPGNQVTANSATGIATVTQINPIDVVFSLPQDRVPEVQAQAQSQANSNAKIAVEAMDRTRGKVLDTGRFSTLNNTIDTTTGTVKAKARFDNTAGALFPNQFVNVRLTLRTVNVLVVPVTAVRTGPSGPYVYVIGEDRTVKMRNVKRGEATVEVMAITEGLTEGEKVVTEGGDRLSDGSRVQLQGDAPRTPGAGGGTGRRRGGGGGEGAPGATPGQPSAPAGASSAPAASVTPAAPAATAPAPAATIPLPTAEQRQRMLDSAKDDPEKLAQRKQFLQQLDKGDPEALERWQRMGQRRREGGGGGGGGGNGGAAQ